MKDGKPTAERQRGRQRGKVKDTVGFERYGLLEETCYEAPEDYPSDAKDYLKGLSRCGTLSGAAKLAGIGVRRVYEMRKQIDGFREEEDVAKDVLADAMEESLFQCGLGLDPRVQGVARVKALNKAIQGVRPEKYHDKKSVEVDGQITWLQILDEVEEEEGD